MASPSIKHTGGWSAQRANNLMYSELGHHWYRKFSIKPLPKPMLTYLVYAPTKRCIGDCINTSLGSVIKLLSKSSTDHNVHENRWDMIDIFPDQSWLSDQKTLQPFMIIQPHRTNDWWQAEVFHTHCIKAEHDLTARQHLCHKHQLTLYVLKCWFFFLYTLQYHNQGRPEHLISEIDITAYRCLSARLQ